MMTFLSKIKFSEKYYPIFDKVLTWRYKKEQEKSLGVQTILNQHLASLQQKLLEIMEAHRTVSNQSMKKQYELDYESVEEKITLAKIERQRIELNYDDMVAFLKYARKIMEHPIEMFLNVSTYNEQMAIYKILFKEFPTYKEVVSGTPKISLFFKIISKNKDEKSLNVTLQRIEL